MNIYRFVFDSDEPEVDPTMSKYNNQTGDYNQAATARVFYMIDRKTGKKYTCPISSSNFAALIEGYMINLEQVRLEYQ